METKLEKLAEAIERERAASQNLADEYAAIRRRDAARVAAA